MGYMCVKANRECECCKMCITPKYCEHCGSDEIFMETEVGWLCADCFAKFIEEEEEE